MGRVRRAIFKLLIILIATLCLDSGRSLLSGGLNNQPVTSLENINDIELPNHHNHSHFYEAEKWTGSPEIDFSDYSGIFVKFPPYPDPLKSGFHNSIWQPAETI
jgi:hypothetical protein